MNGDDLLRALAAADADRPPAPGTIVSPASLRAAAARQQRRRVATGVALTVLLGAAFTTVRAVGAAATDDDDVLLRELCVRLDRAQRTAADWRAAFAQSNATLAAADAHAFARRGFDLELAAARADAIPLPPAPENR